MLYRKAYQKLLDWKESGAKQALCIVGARQIGKTTLVREFAKAEYGSFLEINFVTEPSAAGSVIINRSITKKVRKCRLL